MHILDLFRKKETTNQTQSDSAENMNTNTTSKVKSLSELRAFYGEYHTRLLKALKENGITASPASTEYVDASGRAMFPVVPSSTNCMPLRKDVHGYYSGDECAVFTVKARDAIFALPDNGISIRYLRHWICIVHQTRLGNLSAF